MIQSVSNGILWEHPEANIIYNPVSVSKSKLGKEIFNSNLKHDHPKVFESYRDYMIGESKSRLLGDVQLVQITENKFVMNAFVYWDNQIRLKAVAKTLLELLALVEEYKISAILSSTLGCRDSKTISDIGVIINSIFHNCNSDIYVYKKIRNYKSKS